MTWRSCRSSSAVSLGDMEEEVSAVGAGGGGGEEGGQEKEEEEEEERTRGRGEEEGKEEEEHQNTPSDAGREDRCRRWTSTSPYWAGEDPDQTEPSGISQTHTQHESHK